MEDGKEAAASTLSTSGDPSVAGPESPPTVDIVRETPATIDAAAMEKQVIAAIKTVYDPEIPVDIWELGLIYSIDVSPSGEVHVKMTLTAPACPSAEEIPPTVERKVAGVPGVTKASVEIVWEPPWNKDMMSESAKLTLGFV